MNKNLHPIMLAGTGSDVGKSIITAALCRIFKQDGYRPAPFKAQNMALNSYATPEGLEIGRAQAVQAEAAGVPCHTDMNPLLLKPSSDHTAQVVLNGRPIGNRDAYEYFRKEGREELRKEVNAAFDRLAARYNPIVMEGAGSISEINLRDTDLVNMPMACYAGADVLLVADIDRGGVFASVYGSVMLQTPEDRKRIKGIIVNKFRGDIRLFEPGIKMMEELCGIPVLGVVPYYKDIHIEEEDSVVLDYKRMQAIEGKVNVAVVLLRHLSNFTDFNMLERDERVHLYYTNNTEELAKADIILLPGSKSTLDDLYELRRNGVAQAEKILGNSMKRLNHPNLIPIFLGIALGCILGSTPFMFPGIPQPVKLGLAGGPLIISILISRFGPQYKLITYTTISANLMVREIGISLFLACVGLGAGKGFIETIINEGGYIWIGYGAIITVLPLLIVGFIGRYVFKLNYYTLIGVLSGATTNPPALAYSNDLTSCDAPAVGYATVYPLTMFLRVLTAQLLILSLG